MHDFLGYLLYLCQRGILFALPVIGLALVLLAVAWFIFRKKQQPLPWKKVFVCFVLLFWVALTLFVTLFRGEPGYRQWNFHLFMAWREAWNQFTLQVWLNILLNIALFVPLGFFLPLLAKVFRKGQIMLATGFGASLLIELIQLLTGRGMFDVDDLFTNTLGAMVGWSLILFILTVLARRTAAKASWKKACLAYLGLPVALVCVFAAIFVGYQIQPYGNIADAPVVKADLSQIQWQLDFTPADAPATAPVYQVGRLDKAAADQLGEAFAQKMGITFPDRYYYDDAIIFSNHSSGDFLYLSQQDGTWEYTIGWDKTPVFPGEMGQVSSADILNTLLAWGLPVPQDATFTIEDAGNGFATAVYIADRVPWQEQLLYGTIYCDLQAVDGEIQMTGLQYALVDLVPYQEEEILSPAQAVEQLCAGRSFFGASLAAADQTEIQICAYTLVWLADTKGFYQPVYRFTLQFPDGEQLWDDVAALP